MRSVEGNCFDEVYEKVLAHVMRDPDHVCSPRGQKIKELIAFTFTLNNPRARLLMNESRATNYGFGVGEFIWYWTGRNDLETMLYYNKRMKDFSDDGRTLNSAYGHRMMTTEVTGWYGEGEGMDQWRACIQTLLQDPDSRRAILHINRPQDQFTAVTVGSKDVPCTLSLQFFVRDGRLDLHTHMRSNDVVWGLTYDLFSFTLFQECMLLELRRYPQFRDLELGKYHHTAGSLHVYERHFEQAEKMLDEYRSWNFHDYTRGVMEPIPSLDDLSELVGLERGLRRSTSDRPTELPRHTRGGTVWMAQQLINHRRKRDGE